LVFGITNDKDFANTIEVYNKDFAQFLRRKSLIDESTFDTMMASQVLITHKIFRGLQNKNLELLDFFKEIKCPLIKEVKSPQEFEKILFQFTGNKDKVDRSNIGVNPLDKPLKEWLETIGLPNPVDVFKILSDNEYETPREILNLSQGILIQIGVKAKSAGIIESALKSLK